MPSAPGVPNLWGERNTFFGVQFSVLYTNLKQCRNPQCFRLETSCLTPEEYETDAHGNIFRLSDIQKLNYEESKKFDFAWEVNLNNVSTPVAIN